MLTHTRRKVRYYDAEILGLIRDKELEDEINQADTFNEKVHRAIINAISAIEMKPVLNTVPSLLTVEPQLIAATSTVVTSAPAEASLPVTTAAATVPSTEASDIPVTSAAVTSTLIILSARLSGSLLASPTVTSVPPNITVGLITTFSASQVKLPVIPPVVFFAPHQP